MRVIAAPDSFKGSIGAAEAAAALARGWHQARPSDEVLQLPLADGGEGTLAVLAASVPASQWHTAMVSGPGSAQVSASWLEIGGNEHIIELATAAGLTQLEQLDPLHAHSYGVGELMRHALDAGACQITIALGGSACTDGGGGALAALGARFLDESGCELPLGGAALARLARIDLAGLRPPPPDGVACLTDVRAPLLGPAGAAAVFGPQKGAGAADIVALEAGLAQFAALLGGQPDAPGAGAAGGTGYGLATAWGAALRAGAAQIAEIAGLPAALTDADLVITGEGQYDATSQSGKVVGAVLGLAAAAGVPAAVVAGVLATVPPVAAVELSTLAGGRARAMTGTVRWLELAGRELAGRMAGGAAAG